MSIDAVVLPRIGLKAELPFRPKGDSQRPRAQT
jgi:hypothetical protein